MVQRLAEDFAARVRREAGPEPASQVEKVYWIALSRPPGDEEKQVGVAALKKLAGAWAGPQAAEKALATYCHAIMNSAAFLYVD
jgi:hypothetical protein